MKSNFSGLAFLYFLMISGVLTFLLVQLSEAQSIPKSSATSAQTSAVIDSNSDYQIHKGDKLSIKFLYQPELSDAAVVVRPDGKISLPMVDELKVEGLTAQQVKKLLEKAYREILLDPEINVSIIEFVPQRFFVGGQVFKPGSYDMRAGQTLFQAIILAGGFTPEAHRKYVLHARQLGNKELKVTAIDVTKILTTGNNKEEILLQDGDYIFVPNSKLSKFNSIVTAFRSIMPGYAIQF
jgi:protein involved in polysaccharide export with SLBB domain